MLVMIIFSCSGPVFSKDLNDKLTEEEITLKTKYDFLSDDNIEVIQMMDEREANLPLETQNTRWSRTWYVPHGRSLSRGGWGIGFSDRFNSGSDISHIHSRVEAAGNYYAQAWHWVRFVHDGTTGWHRVDASYFLRGRLAGVASGGSTTSNMNIRLRVWNNTTGQIEENKTIYNISKSWNYNTYIEGYDSGMANVYLRSGHDYTISLIFYTETSGGGFAVGYSDFAYNEFGGNQRQVKWNWVRVQSQ